MLRRCLDNELDLRRAKFVCAVRNFVSLRPEVRAPDLANEANRKQTGSRKRVVPQRRLLLPQTHQCLREYRKTLDVPIPDTIRTPPQLSCCA